MASNTTEQVLKTGMKAYLRLTTWVAGRDNSIGGMWSRLLEETKREMAESKASGGPTAPSPGGSDLGDAAASRAVERASAPRALTQQPSGGLENVERPPLHVSSLQADHAADAAASPKGSGSSPRAAAAPGKPRTPSEGVGEDEGKAETSKADATLSGAGDVGGASPMSSGTSKPADTSGSS